MIEISNLNKTFVLDSGNVDALQDVSLHIEQGTVYGVIGYSGAGKSTLVRCLNLLETPDSGTMTIAGDTPISFENGVPYKNGQKMTAKDQCNLRRQIGMIFQQFNLLDRSTVYDNVAYSLKYTGRSKSEIDKRVRELLQLVGLTDKIDVYPDQLSGGQKQRVAIARALAANPKILLSDEATSALDPDATESILRLLKTLNRKLGITIVIITHEMAVIKAIADRVAVMEDGRVVEEGDVYSIFASPKANITKKFISSASPLGKIDKLLSEGSELVQVKKGQVLVKLQFQKDTVGEHLLTSVVKKADINLNIILANVEYLLDCPFGGIIGVLSGSPENIQKGLQYFNDYNIKVEVLKDGRVDEAVDA